MPLQEQQSLIISLSQLLFVFFNPVILVPAIIIIVVLVTKNKEYKNGAYYQITRLPYSSVKHNIGRYGEYLTYKCLKNFETNGAKFLFNIYIPKTNGETSEIDVLMICSKGIFVFESKNYSGWIFGSENQKNWYQTLPTARGRSHKEHFYNPIMQNRSHIKHLKAFLGEQIPMRSIIVFSDRCTLKSVRIKSNDVSVIKRCNVSSIVSAIFAQIPNNLLNKNEITDYYNKLYPYTQTDEIKKAEHISNICNISNHKSVQQPVPTIVSEPQTDPTEIPTIEQPEMDNVECKTQVSEEQISENSEFYHHEPEGQQPQILKCPNCNGNLVLRTAIRGKNAGNQFYGCSNYPKCKYIKTLE